MIAHVPIDPPSLLRLCGRDVADLLQRIAATELRDLAVGTSRRLLFCDDKGRVVDLPLARREQEAYWLCANEGNADALAAWIERFVITEDVRIERPVAGGWSLRAQGRDEALLPPEQGTPTDEPLALRRHWLREGLFRPRDAADRKLHPLECGLRAHVSFTKGCYIGQEVVARMDSYDKAQRALYWLRGPGAPPRAGAALRTDQRELGRVLEAIAEGDGYLAFAQLPAAWDEAQSVAVEAAESGRAQRVPDPTRGTTPA